MQIKISSETAIEPIIPPKKAASVAFKVDVVVVNSFIMNPFFILMFIITDLCSKSSFALAGMNAVVGVGFEMVVMVFRDVWEDEFKTDFSNNKCYDDTNV